MGIGSASPRIAKLIAARNSCGLVPNQSSTVGTETPAALATARIVVAEYPERTNSALAAASICSRVARARRSRVTDR
jgi:hypothetical protein